MAVHFSSTDGFHVLIIFSIFNSFGYKAHGIVLVLMYFSSFQLSEFIA